MDNSFPESEVSLPEAGVVTISGGDRGGIVTARGTAEGVVIRLDGRVPQDSLRAALLDFLESRKSFLEGNDVALEWVGLKPADIFINEVSELLSKDYKIVVRASRLRETQRVSPPHSAADNSESLVKDISFRRDAPSSGDSSIGLFDGVDALSLSDDELLKKGVSEEKADSIPDSLLWDDPDTRSVYATLRSGQRVETEHSLVVYGDVNSGAELVAGGDIVVLGTLRGIAHAGAYDETGGGRFIFALNLQPTQLRIGSIISRGASDGQRGCEIARVEANMIVVEPYQSRNVVTKRRS